MTYSQLPVVTDASALRLEVLTALLSLLNPTADPAGWRIGEASPEVALATEFATQAAATNAVIQSAADVAYAGFGQSIFGLAQIVGVAATIPVTITVSAVGVQIPAGFTVYGTTSAGEQVAFATTDLIAAPTLTVAAILSATAVGTDANGVPVGELTVVTASSTVVDVTATGPSTGGVDAESLLTYNARLKSNISILSPGGVRAADLQTIATNIPGVARALAIDLLDATNGNTNVARTVSIFPVDSTGAVLTSSEKTALQAAITAAREVNFVVRVADPTYTALTVAYTAKAAAGYGTAAVEASINAAVLAYLSPARWGGTQFDASTGAATDWTTSATIYRNALIGVAQNATGVAYIQTLTLNGGSADVTMTGYAPLPSAASTCDGTVTT